jgi:hypothetical protein
MKTSLNKFKNEIFLLKNQNNDLKNEVYLLKSNNENLMKEINFWKNKKSNNINVPGKSDILKELKIKQLERTLVNYGDKIKYLNQQYKDYVLNNQKEKNKLIDENKRLNNLINLNNLNKYSKSTMNNRIITNSNMMMSTPLNNINNNFNNDINDLNVNKINNYNDINDLKDNDINNIHDLNDMNYNIDEQQINDINIIFILLKIYKKHNNLS